eukprot:s883_g21.t1
MSMIEQIQALKAHQAKCSSDWNDAEEIAAQEERPSSHTWWKALTHFVQCLLGHPRFASNPGGPVARDMHWNVVRHLKKYWNLPPCWQSKSHWTEKEMDPGRRWKTGNFR